MQIGKQIYCKIKNRTVYMRLTTLQNNTKCIPKIFIQNTICNTQDHIHIKFYKKIEENMTKTECPARANQNTTPVHLQYRKKIVFV
jgi:hypothetical protein